MKLLLDENIPHKLRQLLPGHEVFTVAYMGWSGMRNGQLPATAANEGFDALLTVDAGIGYQQNMAILPCSVIIIHAWLANPFGVSYGFRGGTMRPKESVP